MNKEDIIDYLSENGIEEVEEIDYKPEFFVFRFFYDFDDAQLSSARSYSDDEYDGESEDPVWYSEFFLPYLSELALDDVSEIMEEIIDEFDIKVQYINYENDIDNYDYCEFVAVAADKDKNINIDTILEELEL
ncbi:hypothetical protein [Clostridium oryzae]|uniref:Uncharacterized protein n=1 Tax=Clostridium oryzae TaxID=1450648 RepID=A0A1V4IJ91_9CLOT|nr:hypothetical protein [Clostridium oryzae]OPJ59577.1 hypothetical protein CLORY_32240 [Clostridium oryzae]